jgi:hypothetical protein
MGFKQRKLIKYSIPNGTLSISFVAAFSESYSGVKYSTFLNKIQN